MDDLDIYTVKTDRLPARDRLQADRMLAAKRSTATRVSADLDYHERERLIRDIGRLNKLLYTHRRSRYWR